MHYNLNYMAYLYTVLSTGSLGTDIGTCICFETYIRIMYYVFRMSTTNQVGMCRLLRI